jgi:hypothetical protein
MPTDKLTAATITDDKIEQLREEAVGRDDLQVALCDLALHDESADLTVTPEIDESLRAGLESLGVIPEHVGCTDVARQRCADAINAARAQEDTR